MPNFGDLDATRDEARLAAETASVQTLMKTQQDAYDMPFNLRASLPKLAPRNNEQAAQFIRMQHSTDSDDWYRKCLVLQRSARNIPALAPTALSAAHMVPESERVYDIDNWRRGMVGFCDDPFDSNEAGHTFFVCGRDGKIIVTGSNDVRTPGHVDYVRLDFYKERWGDSIQFAATWLNGYDFADFNKPPKPEKNFNTLGERYEDAIKKLKRIRDDKAEKPRTDRIVRILTNDIERMENHLERFAA